MSIHPNTNQESAGHQPEVDPEFQELIEYFVGELPSRIAQLEQASGRDSAAELRVLAHQLKGSAGGFGFPDIGERAAVLERAIDDAGRPESGVDAFRAEIDELVALCRSHCRGS